MRLSDEEVREIRIAWWEEDAPSTVLSEEYGASRSTISRIVQGKVRRDAGGPMYGKLNEEERRRRKSLGARKRTNISEEDVLEIRQDYALGGIKVYELAEEYDVAARTISRLLKGETWQNVGGPIHEDLKRRGEDHPGAVLDEKTVLEMRQLAQERPNLNYEDIADMYGIATMTAWKAISGKSWSHVPFPE